MNKTNKMYTLWGEPAEVSQRAYDSKFQVDAFMVPPDLWDEYWKFTNKNRPEYLKKGRWVVIGVYDTLEEAIKHLDWK